MGHVSTKFISKDKSYSKGEIEHGIQAEIIR